MVSLKNIELKRHSSALVTGALASHLFWIFLFTQAPLENSLPPTVQYFGPEMTSLKSRTML